MKAIIIENIIKITAGLLVTIIGALGAAVLARLSKKTKLANLALATDELLRHTETTVMELQQLYVDEWKTASEDGKLTEWEKKNLHALLLDRTKAKLSAAAFKILSAAGTDLTELILGAGEAVLQKARG